jgi:hypothetical protein
MEAVLFDAPESLHETTTLLVEVLYNVLEGFLVSVGASKFDGDVDLKGLQLGDLRKVLHVGFQLSLEHPELGKLLLNQALVCCWKV